MKRRSFISKSSQFMLALPFAEVKTKLLFTNRKYFEFNIGAIKCTILEDLVYNYAPKDFFSNVEKLQAYKALEGYSFRKDKIPSPFNLMLIESENRKILIDTGIGYSDEPYLIGNNEFVWKGKMLQLLQEINIKSDEITDVVITHFHPDHLGGIFSQQGILNFPNAIFHLPLKEYEYWVSEEAINQPSYFHLFIEKNIKPLHLNSISFIDNDYHEIYPELISVNIPGHTKGQIGLIVGKDNDKVLFIADAFLHPLHIENINWQTKYDQDHKIAKESRLKLLDLAYSNDLRINAFHFDFPGMGKIEKHKGGWKWIYD